MKLYEVSDGCNTWEVEASSAEEAARISAEDDRNELDATQRMRLFWYDYGVYDGYQDHHFYGVLDGESPPCSTDEDHDWGDEGFMGHGGGIQIYYRCQNCRIIRILDTWAQHPSNGSEGWKIYEYMFRYECEEE